MASWRRFSAEFGVVTQDLDQVSRPGGGGGGPWAVGDVRWRWAAAAQGTGGLALFSEMQRAPGVPSVCRAGNTVGKAQRWLRDAYFQRIGLVRLVQDHGSKRLPQGRIPQGPPAQTALRRPLGPSPPPPAPTVEIRGRPRLRMILCPSRVRRRRDAAFGRRSAGMRRHEAGACADRLPAEQGPWSSCLLPRSSRPAHCCGPRPRPPTSGAE